MELKEHIEQRHRELFIPGEVDAIVEISQEKWPLDYTPSCPLCEELPSSVKSYQRHVGRHQAELALFSLPRDPNEEDIKDVDDNLGLNSESSSQSGEQVLVSFMFLLDCAFTFC